MRAFTLLVPAALWLLGLGCAPVDEPERRVDLASSPPADASPPSAGLQQRIEAALANVQNRDLRTTNAFWTIFHGILGSGLETMLLDPEAGVRVRAIDYLCDGGPVRGLSFIPTAHGLDVHTARDFVGQGHQDQFVAEMVQWGLPLQRRFRVNGQEHTFEDFVRHTQMRASVQAGQELSWALLIIGQHRGTEVRWVNERGEALHFEDLVHYELYQPLDEAACGGTHRLFGLTWVYHLHRNRGGDADGVWGEARARIEEQKQLARRFRNTDGSFSTRYLAGPGDAADVQLRIGTTGHVLEWLALALSDAELREAWVQDAAHRLALLILENGGNPVESGALYHAAHGLRIYHARLFDPSSPKLRHLPLPPR